jgi:hypothetical protein
MAHRLSFGRTAARASALVTASFLALSTAPVCAQQAVAPSPSGASQTIAIDGDDIGGTVTGAQGPEAGVWVIAETHDLPTRFIRIVVTDDQGRYVIPDLPKATYDVWVRGYGLVDSPKVKAEPGKLVDHKAVPAPDDAAAAHYYPAIHWFAMLKMPDKSLFPGTGPEGNGMPKEGRSFYQWVDNTKSNGCVGCHGLGNEATRLIPKSILQETDGDIRAAWERRIQSGQASESMVTQISRIDAHRALDYFADWTERITKGELPKTKPARPQGVERNVVVTLWDWGNEKLYLHDEISTDKRHPTLNPYGKIYGAAELSSDLVPVLDPQTNTASTLKLPVRDPKTPTTKDDPMFGASPYWGDERIWDSQTSAHNPMWDDKGRIWFTSRIRPPATPDFCQKGELHPSAKLTPIKTSNRQVSFYDPKTGKFTLINTCFSTHHLIFAEDENNTLWLSGGGPVVGWVNTKMLDETGDEVKSQGWTALVLDANGNGKRDEAVGPRDPVDPAKDKLLPGGYYGIAYSPVDGAIWGSIRNFPGWVVRLAPGKNPPETALAEVYEVPWTDAKAPNHGYTPRGMDIDRHGVVWMPFSSGHLASFDRSKCKAPLNGPKAATGKHCPEGWTVYPFPGPQFEGLDDPGSAESAYYVWVDQFNTLGLGENVPVATGNENEGMLALVNGKFVTLRVPYPMGFYAKGLDGRIDDANAGWKGRGLWTTIGSRAPFHMEGGKINKPKVIKFQMRQSPLDK